MKSARLASIATATLGLVLLGYMIVVEGEPGAVPLALVGVGAAGVLLTRSRARRAASHPRRNS